MSAVNDEHANVILRWIISTYESTGVLPLGVTKRWDEGAKGEELMTLEQFDIVENKLNALIVQYKDEEQLYRDILKSKRENGISDILD